jgi:hypothetical protein
VGSDEVTATCQPEVTLLSLDDDLTTAVAALTGCVASEAFDTSSVIHLDVSAASSGLVPCSAEVIDHQPASEPHSPVTLKPDRRPATVTACGGEEESDSELELSCSSSTTSSDSVGDDDKTVSGKLSFF